MRISNIHSDIRKQLCNRLRLLDAKFLLNMCICGFSFIIKYPEVVNYYKGKPQECFIKSCDLVLVFIMRKNANTHHYEMYIIGHGFKLHEGEIITYKTIFTSGIHNT